MCHVLLIVAIFHLIVEENFVNLKYLCKGGVRQNHGRTTDIE